MATWMKKLSLALLAVLFAAFTAWPAVTAGFSTASLADAEEAPEAEDVLAPEVAVAEPAGDCTVTLEYYENVNYEDPDVPVDNEGRFHLGTRTLTGLHVGDVIDTWDYVADIPGFFFFDAWPARLTVSDDPAQNVIKLFYFKRWDNEYTVNYYLMSGADLTADNWTDALNTGNVQFTKMGSETFDGQRVGTLVEGDAYEYKIDGTYVIDTYPAEIRIGTNPDNNVINVLYTPDSMHPVDDAEVPDVGVTPPNNGLPGDTVTDADGIVGALPEDTQQTDELYQDMVGWNDSDASQSAPLGQTGDSTAAWMLGTLAVAAVVMGGLGLLARWHGRKRANG